MFSTKGGVSGGYNNWGYQTSQSSVGYSSNEGKEEAYICPNFQEIIPQGSLSPSTFASGSYDYIISTGNTTGVIFNRSFFRIDLQVLGKATGANPPAALIPPNNIALAPYAAGALWSNISASISNQQIDSVSQYCSIANTLCMRLGYGANMIYDDSDLFYSEPNFYTRQSRLTDKSNFIYSPTNSNYYDYCVIPRNFPAGLVATLTYVAAVPPASAKLTIAFTGDNLQGLASFADIGIYPGDTFYYAPTNAATVPVAIYCSNITIGGDPAAPMPASMDVTGAVIIAANNYTTSNASALTSTNKLANFIVNRTSGIYNTTLAVPNIDQNNITLLYSPPLGLFQSSEPLCGDFRISLTPSADYATQIIQAMNNKLVPGTDYNVSVSSVKLYAYTVQYNFSPERPLVLNLLEQVVYQRTLTSAQANFEFTVPPSTRALAIFFGDNRSGKSGALSVPSSQFRTLDGLSAAINTLQVTYGSITMPIKPYITSETNYSPSFTNTTVANYGPQVVNSAYVAPTYPYANQQQIRYLDYVTSTGKIFTDAAAEKFQDWLASPIYYFDFNFASNSVATNVSTQVSFGTGGASTNPPGYVSNGSTGTYNGNMYLCAFYSVVVKGQYQNNILNALISAQV